MWDKRYQTPEHIFGDQPCQWFVMNQHRLPQSGEALALGDREGRNGMFLAELGLQVTAVDLSEVGLSKAATWRQNAGSQSKQCRQISKTTDLLYDLDALIGDFQSLRILEAFDGLAHLEEGTRHSGIDHIVRLVLQKPKQ